MPELPEVETTRKGIEPHLLEQRIAQVIVRERRLRWHIPEAIEDALTGQHILAVNRRGKYLLLKTGNGTAILHLGMSGSLRILPDDTPAKPHDHVDIVLANEMLLRLRDPRRFGALLWTDEDPARHPLLAKLGPEPFSDSFVGDYLYKLAHKRRLPVKAFIMNSRVVVGLGNIYANEALHAAGIHPARAAGRISKARYAALADASRSVLRHAIAKGGTSLRDFLKEDGTPGYFQMELQVYGRRGENCPRCKTPIEHAFIGQRSSYFCPRCQR